MKRKYVKYKSGIALFFSALLVVGMINLVVPKPTYSEEEKRALATMPEFSFSALADGSYISGVSTYLSDTFLGRESLVSYVGKLKKLYGINDDKTPTFIPNTGSDDKGIAEDSSSAAESAGTQSHPASGVSSQETSSAGTSSADYHEEGDVVKTDIGLILVNSTVFQLYGYAPKVNERYAKNVSLFAEKYPTVNTMCMVVPINSEFYAPEGFQTTSQKESIEKIYSMMSDKVTTVDAYGTIAQHLGEEIYFRTDHHWTQLGAYYGYTAFAQTAGITSPMKLDGLRTANYTGFLGSLYKDLKGKVDRTALENNPDTLTVYYPDYNYQLSYYPKESITTPASYLGKGTLVAENPKSYMCFIHGDQPLEKIENLDNQNGKTLIIFKESYANAFVPFVCHDYQTTLVVDPRYFTQNLSELMSMYDVTDALFLNYIMAPGTSQRVNEIEKMITK
ncbi:MAG: DHHW family protein [Acutalibacteraceae bacterium]|jgi:hypothetical protein